MNEQILQKVQDNTERIRAMCPKRLWGLSDGDVHTLALMMTKAYTDGENEGLRNYLKFVGGMGEKP